jgi:hypothetical protein
MNANAGRFAIRIDTTAPTGAGSTTLFDSIAAWGQDALPGLDVKRISFNTMNDQAGTLNASRAVRGSTTYDIYMSIAVGIPAANNISGPYDFLIDTYWNWKLVWVNGGSNQTVWRPEMHGHEDRVKGS